MAKAKTVRKRREKKNIERGTAHIRSSFNNTIVTMSDINGKALPEHSISEAPRSPLLSQHRWRRKQRLKRLWSTA